MNRYGWLGLLAAVSVTWTVTAMPSRNDLKKVSPTVNELMAGDMKAVKAGELKQKDAADHAVNYAREATDEASKFLFYKGAFGLYVKGRAYSDALRTLELLKAEVKDVPDKVLLEIIGGKLKDVPKEDGGALVALYESLDRKLRYQNDVARLEAALKSNPKDADSRRQLAVRRAQLGDWPAALKDFALLEGAEAKAAKNEQAGELKAAADGWWDLAANTEEDEQTLFRRHAADLYRKAIEKGKVTGIQKSLAQKRADEYPAEGAAVAAAAAPAAPERGRQNSDKPTVAASDAPKAVVKPGKGITLKLKKGVPLEFVHCPAGTYTKDIYADPHKVTISRPFFMTRTPITIEQYQVGCLGEKINPRQFGHYDKFFDQREFGCANGKAGMPISGRDRSDFGPKAALTRVRSWCKELTAVSVRQLPKGYVVRFPTAAEFEYAARAGSDDKDNLFVKQDVFTEAEEASLRVPIKRTAEVLQKYGWDVPTRLGQNCRDGWAGHMLFWGGFPWSVAACQANAWGISDVRGYFKSIVVADHWTPSDQVLPYFVKADSILSKDGAIDPIASVPDGFTAGHVLQPTDLARAGEQTVYPRQLFLALGRPNGKGTPVEDLWRANQTGFFLVIAPDVSTLTAITPPKE